MLMFCASSPMMLLLLSWQFDSWWNTDIRNINYMIVFFPSRTPWRRWRRQWPVRDPRCRGTASRRSSRLPLIWHQCCPLLRPLCPHAWPPARPRCRLVSRLSPSISACRAEEEEDLGARREKKCGTAGRLAKQGGRNYKVEKVFLLIMK